jgi:hypothetical protein
MLAGNTKHVLLAANKQTIRDWNGRGNHSLSHVVLGEQFKFPIHVRHEDNAVFPRGIEFPEATPGEE